MSLPKESKRYLQVGELLSLLMTGVRLSSLGRASICGFLSRFRPAITKPMLSFPTLLTGRPISTQAIQLTFSNNFTTVSVGSAPLANHHLILSTFHTTFFSAFNSSTFLLPLANSARMARESREGEKVFG